jgi:uncharacterized protein (DUF1697 family)
VRAGRRAAARSDARVALLRGVNITATSTRVAMSDLRELFEGLGFRNVRTLLNSGNIVFSTGSKSGDVLGRIEKALAARVGRALPVVVLTGDEVVAAVEGNPLGACREPVVAARRRSQGPADGARLKPLLKQRWTPEKLAVGERVAYLWCAKGVAKSPLGAAVDPRAREDGHGPQHPDDDEAHGDGAGGGVVRLRPSQCAGWRGSEVSAWECGPRPSHLGAHRPAHRDCARDHEASRAGEGPPSTSLPRASRAIANDRALLTARVMHRDNLEWTTFFVTSAELSNGVPLELVSSYDTAQVPASFELVFATPPGASLPETPVVSLHVGLVARAWYLDRWQPSWSEHTLVFRATSSAR